ncbi:MAG: hypothetical protein IT379_13590 [Deltaproteobacteria bacterium]|nr:hypothetical protein [Deltaproteobacteria bacterium]
MRPPSPFRTAAMVSVVLVAVAAIAGAMLHRETLDTWMRGESDFLGKRRWEPPHPVDRAVLRRIDLDRVHARLWPRWTMALSRSNRVADDPTVRLAFRELRTEAGKDANLAALLDELDRRTRQGVGENAERVLFLTWAWSDYLDRAGFAWRIDASIRRHQDGAIVYATTYRGLADVAVRVGERDYRARLFRRADRTNVVELYLGQASTADEGAIVVLDRVRDLAMEDIWPMLDAANDDGLDPLARAYASEIRREAAAAIPAREMNALRATARARAAMEKARQAVRTRYRECESGFTIGQLPWSGLDERWRRRIRAMGRAAVPEDVCPKVTPDEAEALAAGSESMVRTPDVHRALAALVAWLARSVVAHEARHVADDDAVGIAEPLDCDGCPDWMDATSRAEMSAFLASFATSGLGYTSLYVACHETRSTRGPHATAMSIVAGRLGAHTCTRGPAPRRLYDRASDLERTLLGRSDPVVLPRSFPPRVWLE